MSDDPYHTEFVSGLVDHFYFIFVFFHKGGGARRFVEKSTFFNPSLMVEEKLHNNLGEDLFYSVKHPFEQKL